MKDKKMVILIAGIILLIIGLSYLKTQAPKPADWTPTFYNTKTDPYGTYITYQLLEDIFEKKNIRSTRRPIYNNLKKGLEDYFYYDTDEQYDADYSDYDYSDYNNGYTDEVIINSPYDEDDEESLPYQLDEANTSGSSLSDPSAWYHNVEVLKDTTSYLFVNSSFTLDKTDMEYLLDFVGLGNNVFISAENISKRLMDTLGIKVKHKYNFNSSDSVYYLVDYPDKKYSFKNLYGHTRIIQDSALYKIRPLALNSRKDTVFLELTYGRGHFYIHTLPTAFANVNLLQTDKYDFAFRCLSYMPENSKIIWDEYQKQGGVGEDSMFRVLFTSKPLTIAFYLIVAGLFLFMIFRAKRTQRIIPIITPPVNSSVEFLNTISNLYYRKKDFKTIAGKRHAYFLDFIRKNYYISTESVNDEFIVVLSGKSGVDKGRLSELFRLYNDIQILPHISNDMFLRYNSLLEEFYKNVKNK